MSLYNGIIVKGVGGFYYVDTTNGIYECRARGVFRNKNITPLVGDMVQIDVDECSRTGAVEKIEKRRNSLIRPPVANVTLMAIVVATASPKPNLYLLDKLIASAEYADIKPLICFNKTDLEKGDEIADIYEKAGFDTLRLSAETGYNLDKLKEELKDEVTVFAGNSGVGKSSLLNGLFNDELFETGEVSDRVERGKHTTRHSELKKLQGGGYIIDTPGFGSFDITLLEIQDTSGLFREFEPYIYDCRFRDCSHTVESGCRVLEALEEGKISKSRHESYVRLVNEIREKKKRR